jgi:2-iminobutanoate/2-iminopropanoate deaminase
MKPDIKPEAITTKEAPEAIGPYSQAIRFGNFLFLSGQIPLDPRSMQIVGTAIEEQTERVIANIKGVLKSQGLTLSNVVKTTVFLKNMTDFPKFNETYQKHLTPPFPARSTVEVARLPKDVLVEIEALAVMP